MQVSKYASVSMQVMGMQARSVNMQVMGMQARSVSMQVMGTQACNEHASMQ